MPHELLHFGASSGCHEMSFGLSVCASMQSPADVLTGDTREARVRLPPCKGMKAFHVFASVCVPCALSRTLVDGCELPLRRGVDPPTDGSLRDRRRLTLTYLPLKSGA